MGKLYSRAIEFALKELAKLVSFLEITGTIFAGRKNNGIKIHENFGHFSTPLKPGPGGLDPSPIYHSKAHKLLYIPNISDIPDGQLTCLLPTTVPETGFNWF